MIKILQLKIRLNGVRPAIWRRFLVEDSISFKKLHKILQVVMGWENYHLYEFEVENMKIGVPCEDYDFELKDSKKDQNIRGPKDTETKILLFI